MSSLDIKIFENKWDMGFHMKFNRSLYDSIEQSISCGMYSMQIFMGNPKSFSRHKATEKDIIESKKLLERFPLHVISHFPYVANLAGSKNIAAWDGDKEQDMKTMNVIKSLEYELKIISNFTTKTNGVVIHPGNHKDIKKGLKTISKSINKINFSPQSKLLLENSSGGGTSLATTFEEIKIIIDGVEKNKQKHIGVCIDTAHIFGFGLYDLRDDKQVCKMFKDFDKIIGKDKLCLLHLNDSKQSDNKRHNAPFGSKKDCHETIGEGYIWKNNFHPLKTLLNICKNWNVPIILETSNCNDLEKCLHI
jgi:deoxyribonuclease-4